MMSNIYYLAQIIDSKQTKLPHVQADQSAINKILTIVFVLIGALAFFFLVIAGLRYILSQGDPSRVSEAKNQMVYAIVGLIVAATAGLIVNFVLSKV